MSRFMSVGLAVVALGGCFASTADAAEGLSRAMPEDAVVHVEVRSPGRVLALLEGWLKGMGGPDKGPLDEPMGELAREFGLEPAQVRPEIRKLGGIALAVTRIDTENEEPNFLIVMDFGRSKLLADAFRRQVKTFSEQPAATVRGVPIHGEDDCLGGVVDNHLVFGQRLKDVKAAVEKMKGANAPSLAASARFRKAVSSVKPDSPVFSYVDVQLLYKFFGEMEAENDDLAMLDAALDLKTIDSLVSSFTVKEGATVAEYVVLFSGENRTWAALRSSATRRTVTKFFSAGYALVHAGALVDGGLQWQRLKALIIRLEAMEEGDEFAMGVDELEEALKIRIDEELSNVTEYAVGVRRGEAGWQGGPDLLFVLKVKDVVRARELMKKAEDAILAEEEGFEIGETDAEGVKVRFLAGEDADSDYAWAVMDSHLLLGTSVRIVSEAVGARARNKCVFDEPGAKRVLANLHPLNSRIVLVNPSAFVSGVPRNPHAPSPGMVGASALERPERLEVKIDCTHLGALARMLLGAAMLK